MATKTRTPLTDATVNNERQAQAAEQANIPANVAEELGVDLGGDDRAEIMRHVQDALSAEAASVPGDAERWVGIETQSEKKADQGVNLDADVESPPSVGDAPRWIGVEGDDPKHPPPPIVLDDLVIPEAPGPDPSIYGDKPRWLAHEDDHTDTLGAAKRINVAKAPKAQRFNVEAAQKALERERGSLEERMMSTAEIRILAPAQDRINDLSLLEEILPYVPKEVHGERRFGCGPHERFHIHMPGRDPVVFTHHTYTTDDPLEIGAILRVVAQGRIGEDDLVELDPSVEAYFHKDGTFLGWEKPGSVNVRRWEKQRILRGL